MAKQRWAPDAARFNSAVDELTVIYKDILHDQTEQALAGHGEVLERMRKLEKSIGTTTAHIAKQLKADYTPIGRESQALGQALSDAQISTEETMQTLRRIDELLPAQDRLLAPTNRRHYPHLHRVASGSSPAAADDGVAAQPPDRAPTEPAPPPG